MTAGQAVNAEISEAEKRGPAGVLFMNPYGSEVPREHSAIRVGCQ